MVARFLPRLGLANWGRGLFRAWVVGSLAWITAACVLVATAPPEPKPFATNRPLVTFDGLIPADRRDPFAAELARREAAARAGGRTPAGTFGFVVGPPVAMLLLGWGLFWIGAGFRRDGADGAAEPTAARFSD